VAIAQTNPPILASEVTKTHFTPDQYRAMEETASPNNVTNTTTERLLLCLEVQKFIVLY
jgi:hypothetical protein